MRLSLALIILAWGCSAEIGDFELIVYSGDQFTMVWEYEFAPGGTLTITANLDPSTPSAGRHNNSLQLLLCSKKQIEQLRVARLAQVCNGEVFSYIHCIDQANLGLGYNMTYVMSDVITNGGWHHLLQLNCHQDDYILNIRIDARNPNGEFLSLAKVPFKTVFMFAPIVWFALFLLWVYNWKRYSYFNIQLQRMLSVIPFAHSFVALADFYLWYARSSTGVEPTVWAWVAFVMRSLLRGLSFGFLLVIAKGWCITRRELGLEERKYIVSLSCLLALSTIIYEVYRGFLLFFVVMIYVLILRAVFAGVVDNTAALHTQFQLLRSTVTIDAFNTPAYTKMVMFKRFQVITYQRHLIFISCTLR